MKIPLAGVLIAGGAFGIALPLFEGEDRPTRSYEQPGSAAEQADFNPAPRVAVVQEDAAVWDDNTVLERERDGHFYAEVFVDGQSYRMLVDTGASVVALTAEDALAMGLQWREDEIANVGQGASGAVNGVNATIDRLQLGNHEATGVRAVIIPEGAGISLLGQSFLSTIGSVEISGDRMTLGNGFS